MKTPLSKKNQTKLMKTLDKSDKTDYYINVASQRPQSMGIGL